MAACIASHGVLATSEKRPRDEYPLQPPPTPPHLPVNVSTGQGVSACTWVPGYLVFPETPKPSKALFASPHLPVHLLTKLDPLAIQNFSH